MALWSSRSNTEFEDADVPGNNAEASVRLELMGGPVGLIRVGEPFELAIHVAGGTLDTMIECEVTGISATVSGEPQEASHVPCEQSGEDILIRYVIIAKSPGTATVVVRHAFQACEALRISSTVVPALNPQPIPVVVEIEDDDEPDPTVKWTRPQPVEPAAASVRPTLEPAEPRGSIDPTDPLSGGAIAVAASAPAPSNRPTPLRGRGYIAAGAILFSAITAVVFTASVMGFMSPSDAAVTPPAQTSAPLPAPAPLPTAPVAPSPEPTPAPTEEAPPEPTSCTLPYTRVFATTYKGKPGVWAIECQEGTVRVCPNAHIAGRPTDSLGTCVPLPPTAPKPPTK